MSAGETCAVCGLMDCGSLMVNDTNEARAEHVPQFPPACPTCGAAPGDCGHCPKCGGELFTGYGLMGGGIGVYEGCNDCDYFDKTQDPEET